MFDDLIESSIVKGLVFCAYDKLGPQPIYTFPNPIKGKDFGSENKEKVVGKGLEMSFTDYMQISIKTLSLLLGDGMLFNKDGALLKQYRYFGVIPFPDFHLTALTFFHFVDVKFDEAPLASSFCILVDENQRGFLYNNINRLKNIVIDFFNQFDKIITKEFLPQVQVERYFKSFLKKIITIEKTPATPITSQRKMKILFAGLDDSGKTSFLLSVDRKFSKLIGLRPTKGADVSSIEALGATIFLWDLGGQKAYHEKYLNKAQIYLFEADLLFYFIDIRNKARFEESLEYLKNIKKALAQLEQATPIIFVLSKGDPDIIDSKDIKNNLKVIKKELAKISLVKSPEIYTTSVFQIFTILRAFSSGIAKLSPNRGLIEHNLHTFSSKTDACLALLLSNDGLVLAEYYTPEAMEITEMARSEDLLNVFEVIAPQFALLFKIFSKYKAAEKDEAIFKVSNSVILFKKIKVLHYDMFILFLLNNENTKEKINKNIQDFLDRTQDLLIRYIS
jgi:GTPase SAR1 family protein